MQVRVRQRGSSGTVPRLELPVSCQRSRQSVARLGSAPARRREFVASISMGSASNASSVRGSGAAISNAIMSSTASSWASAASAGRLGRFGGRSADRDRPHRLAAIAAIDAASASCDVDRTAASPSPAAAGASPAAGEGRGLAASSALGGDCCRRCRRTPSIRSADQIECRAQRSAGIGRRDSVRSRPRWR